MAAAVFPHLLISCNNGSVREWQRNLSGEPLLLNVKVRFRVAQLGLSLADCGFLDNFGRLRDRVWRRRLYLVPR